MYGRDRIVSIVWSLLTSFVTFANVILYFYFFCVLQIALWGQIKLNLS